MSKRISIIFLSFLIGPLISFATVSYTRTPSDSGNINNPVNISVSIDDIHDLTCDFPATWGLNFCHSGICPETESPYISPWYASTTTSISFTATLPVNDYTAISYVCKDEQAENAGGDYLEGDETYTIFTIIAAAVQPTITYPTSTAQSMLAKVSDTLSDNGFLYILIAAAAIPLVFYVASQFIELIPKDKSKK